MSVPTSLIRRHTHVQALSAIGLKFEKPVFPAILTCPLCQQNTLKLYDDTHFDNIWLNCDTCAAHGDIITFGAQIWNLSLPDTLTKFSELRIISEAAAHRAVHEYDRYIGKQRAAENFLYDAKAQLWTHDDDFIACRFRDLGLKHEIPACNDIIGVAQYEQVANLCGALSRTKPTKTKTDRPYVVFPFYDLPGRLTGFLLAQYTDKHNLRQRFVAVSSSRRRKPEAGYFFLDALTKTAVEQFKNHQFITDDPFWVLQTQCAQIAVEQPVLPIAASYHGHEAESYGNNWASLGFARRIFHGSTLSPELISRTCNAQGYTSVIPIGPRVKPITSLVKMRKHAQTWQTALKTAIDRGSEIAAQGFLARLCIEPEKLHNFLTRHESKFSSGFKDRAMVAARAAPQPSIRSHRYGKIIEKEDGWWTHYGRQISNVRIVISAVIQSDTGDKMYRGYIYTEDTEYEFHDDAKKIESLGLLAYAATVLAPHKKLVTYEKMWNASSHLIAIRLHEPKLITVSSRHGWDEEASVFRTHQYEITHAGEIKQTTAWPGQHRNRIFPAPTAAAPEALYNLLTPSYENAFIWSVTAGILTNLIAPILRKDFQAIGVAGNNFDTALKISSVLGCEELTTATTQKTAGKKLIRRTTENISWPIIAHAVFHDEVFSAHTPHLFNRPLLLRLQGAAAIAAVSFGWHVITDIHNSATNDFSGLKYALPAYIQHVLQSRAAMFQANRGGVTAVVKNLHEWLTSIYGQSFNLACANNLITTPAQAHIALRTALKEAVEQEKIAVLPRQRTSKQPGNYFVRKPDYWWINRRAVDKYFYNQQSVAPNWLGIVNLLKQDAVYGGDEVIHNMRGIYVATSWCDKLYSEPVQIKKETG